MDRETRDDGRQGVHHDLDRQEAIRYIREKIDQLLKVMGTLPLRPEELDDETLIELDPIGIIAESFSQVLENLRSTSHEASLAHSELRAILESAGTGILVLDHEMRIVDYNQRIAAELFHSQSDVHGESLLSVVAERELAIEQKLVEQIKQPDSEVAEADISHGDADYHLIVTPLREEDGSLSRVVLIYSDITERKRAEDHIQRLAYYDPLTGLPNRALIRIRLEDSIAAAQRHEYLAAVLFVDLDRFKPINDTLGHAIGDEVLVQVAKRLGRCVRSSDIVARLGGDEFLVVLPEIRRQMDASRIAQTILKSLALPYRVSDKEMYLGASIGISIYPADGKAPADLLRTADLSMYAAKESGRNTYQFFSAELNQQAQERMEMESHIRGALRNDEFLLHYQPQIDLTDKRMTGCEALVRWRAGDGQLVPPDRFIPVAEDTGLIVSLGEWVLLEACRQAQAWRTAGLKHLQVAVNLSAVQLRNCDQFCDLVEQTLSDTGLPADHLELELTESMLMDHEQERIKALTRLKDYGLRLSLDDFGTGYSSLSYLKRFPLDRIKIAQTFVRDITTDSNDAAIVKTIIAMARSLGLEVIAEGVETEAQFDFLRKHGCTQMQGYYFSRPLDSGSLEAFCRERCEGVERIADTAF